MLWFLLPTDKKASQWGIVIMFKNVYPVYVLDTFLKVAYNAEFFESIPFFFLTHII